MPIVSLAEVAVNDDGTALGLPVRSGNPTNAANLATLSESTANMVAFPGEWSVEARPAVNTVASITRAAGAAGVRHVCKSIAASLVAGAVAPAAIQVDLVLRDGAAGVGTVLWSSRLALQAIAGFMAPVDAMTGMNIVGSPATAMTLEFTAAPGANAFEGVALTGTDAS